MCLIVGTRDTRETKFLLLGTHIQNGPKETVPDFACIAE